MASSTTLPMKCALFVSLKTVWIVLLERSVQFVMKQTGIFLTKQATCVNYVQIQLKIVYNVRLFLHAVSVIIKITFI